MACGCGDFVLLGFYVECDHSKVRFENYRYVLMYTVLLNAKPSNPDFTFD